MPNSYEIIFMGDIFLLMIAMLYSGAPNDFHSNNLQCKSSFLREFLLHKKVTFPKVVIPL